MASNSAAVNVSSRSSSSPKPVQDPTLRSSGQKFVSEFKREFPKPYSLSDSNSGNGNETLYSIQAVGERRPGGGAFDQERFNHNTSNYVYGNYWHVPIPVYSLATFEAQLCTQMDLKETISVATSRKGNDAYSFTKNILEEALVAPNEEEAIVEENDVSPSVNIIA